MNKHSGLVNVLSWNIAGVKNIFEAWDFIKNFDLVIIQETCSEKSNESYVLNRLSKEFSWTTKPAIRVSKKGRAKGGTLIAIKKVGQTGTTIKEW